MSRYALVDLKSLDLSTAARECPGCQRQFFPIKARCRDHCGLVCCRNEKCLNAKPRAKAPRSIACRVCGRPKSLFKRFSPCSVECHRVYYQSERKTICTKHQPTLKERIHVGYCRLECYNSWEYGSRERALQTQREWEWKNKENREARRLEKKERGGI